MKKLFITLLAVVLLVSVFAPVMAEEKAFQVSTVAEGIGDRVHYPWQNMTFPANVMYRTAFLAETDLMTLKDDLLKADYQLSDDRLTYTFEFVEGGTWSDGEPVTPEDIAFSIKMNLRAAISNGIFTTAFGKIEGADAWKDGSADDLSGIVIDGNTITITLTDPYSWFAQTLAQFAILPEHVLKDEDPLEFFNSSFWTAPVTSGMYRLEEINPGNYYSLVVHEGYPGAQPKIKKIINNFVTDPVTAAQAGLQDFFNSNAPGVISELKKLDSMTMYPVNILFYRYFIANMKGTDGHENPVMQDVRVRKAILHAIDRETLAEGLFTDLAHVVNSGILNEYPEYNGFEYEYNPEKAKELLKEAGYDPNYKFKILYYYGDQTSVDFMEAIAYYLQEVGINASAVKSNNGTVDLFQTRDYDIGYKGLSAFNIGEWYNEYSSGNANFSNIIGGDPAFDELIGALATAGTKEEMSETLTKLQDLEQELVYKLPLYTFANNIFINTDHVIVPEGTIMGNPWYRTDIGFENWELK